MKAVDLPHQEINLDELPGTLGDDPVQITAKDGRQFVLEAADDLESEARELGRSARFMEFLAGRAAEPARTPLAEVESRLAGDDADGCDATEQAPPRSRP